MPDSVVAALEISPGDKIADIGASSGYFSRRFSPLAGVDGKVYAVDIDLETLGGLASRAEQTGLANIDTVHARPDDPSLPEKVDLVFICNTLHHIRNQADYLRRLKGSLSPDARLAIVDFYKKPLPVGPQSLEHKLSREQTLEILKEAGYRVAREFSFLPYQYFIVSRPE